MPRSIIFVPTTDSIVYNAEHEALAPTELATVGNQDKYLKNNGGTLEWKAKNVANGIVELNSLGLISNNLLPSYVDDVLTYANYASFPVSGETGKIYVDESNGYSYRWTGSSYYNISTQSFYTKAELDSTLATKLNLSGGTMSGNLALGSNNISGVNSLTTTNTNTTNLSGCTLGGTLNANTNNISSVGTLSATTVNATNVNPTNLGACTLTGTLSTGSQAIIGTTGAIDVLHLKGTNLRSRDDALCATLSTGSLTLQNSMNANSQNISSINTLGATTGNITTVNATTVNTTNLSGCTFTGAVNLGMNQLTSGANIVTNGTVSCVNLVGNGFFSQSASQLHFQLADTSILLSKPINANAQNISNIATASGTTATFTNVNPTNLGGCNLAGAMLLNSGVYIYGPANNNTIHLQNLKGDILVAGTNGYHLAYMTGSGLQLQMDLDANNVNINNANKIEFASLAGTDGTVFATSVSNNLTLSRNMNANSQSITNVNQINGLTYKGCKKYQVTGTSVVGSNNLSITVDAGFTIMSYNCTVDLRGRSNDKFLVTPSIVDWTETLGTAGLGIVLTVLAIQN